MGSAIIFGSAIGHFYRALRYIAIEMNFQAALLSEVGFPQSFGTPWIALIPTVGFSEESRILIDIEEDL